jgi:hypothetical protein
MEPLRIQAPIVIAIATAKDSYQSPGVEWNTPGLQQDGKIKCVARSIPKDQRA